MQTKAYKLNQDFWSALYSDLILEMARRRIFLVNETQLDEAQQRWITKYFQKSTASYHSPADAWRHWRSSIPQRRIRLYHCWAEKRWTQPICADQIPTDHLPRFVMVPEQKANVIKTIILLDNIIRYCLESVFQSFSITTVSRATQWKWLVMPNTI